MTDRQSSTSLVQKLTLLVLILILGCLGAIVFKLYDRPSAPTETAEVVLTDPPVVEALPTTPATPTNFAPLARTVHLPIPQALSRPLPPPTQPVTIVAAPAPPLPAVVVQPVLVPGPPVVMPATATVARTSPLRYEAQPTGCVMELDGDSTAHKWACIGKIISGYFEVEPAWATDLSLQSVTCLGSNQTPPKCGLKIPIRTLKSQVAVGSSIMDSRMMAEMNAKRYPTIDYQLTEMTLKSSVPPSGTPVAFDTKGLLMVSGHTNVVSFPIIMERIGADSLKFTGILDTTMTACGIRPPEFTVMGIGMRAHDPIALSWTWLVSLRHNP